MIVYVKVFGNEAAEGGGQILIVLWKIEFRGSVKSLCRSLQQT